MKSIKDLRENYNLITEKEEHDMNKLTQLVRAGLFDAKKISALKRAMDKPADKMTAQEKRMLINLLDALMAEVLTDKQVYRKIKQDVMMKEAKDYFATPDPRVKRFGYPSQKEAPTVLLLKRKAIRVFPDGQKVALYYAQAIDKYVSIPYNEIGINEEVELDEFVLPLIRGAAALVPKIASKIKKPKIPSKAAAKPKPKTGSKPKPVKKSGKGSRLGAAAAGAAAGAAASGGSGGSSTEPKYFTPMSSKLQATVSGPKREGGADARAERERQASLRASKAVANESVNLDGNIFEINSKVSPKVLSLYESLNKKNKKKMVEMMNESAESLEKVISFAVRQ